MPQLNDLYELMQKHELSHLGLDELKACYFGSDAAKAEELIDTLDIIFAYDEVAFYD